MKLALHLPDEAAQLAFGQRFAPWLMGCAGVIFLIGNLGAGKTTLARGILRGLGVSGIVRSPTYTLIEPYIINEWTVYHLDLYRLSDPEELEYLGWRDLLAEGGLLLIEWPERGAAVLPAPELTIEITPDGSGRRVQMSGQGRGTAWLEQLGSGGIADPAPWLC